MKVALVASTPLSPPTRASTSPVHSGWLGPALAWALVCALVIFIAGCSSGGGRGSATRGGGYYQNDGPDASPPKDLHAIPNATPRIEQHAAANMRPYTVLGQRYTPLKAEQSFRQTGTASWYGKQFHGRKTANGEIYDMYAMTAAHPTLPLPSYAKVTRPKTGQSIIVRINDRGPFHSSRIIDLSYVAASKLDLIGSGHGTVIVEAITHNDIRAGSYQESDSTLAADTKSNELDRFLGSLGTIGHEEPAPLSHIAGSSVPMVYLQFGAYRNAQSASDLASRLNQEFSALENLDAHIEPAGDLFRVQVGPYASRAEALTAAQIIETETGYEPTLAVR